MRGTLLFLALTTAGCAIHRAKPLPSNIPAVAGKARDAFALRYIDIAVGTGADAAQMFLRALANLLCSRRAWCDFGLGRWL